MFRIPDTARLLTSHRTGVAVAACLAVATLVSGCGGGDRVKSFQPTQIIAFGDETSAFDDTASSGSPLVDFTGLTGLSVSNGSVPYRARYTINVVADAPVSTIYCKTTAPNPTLIADCDSGSTALVLADYPTSDFFYLPQSSAYGYRLLSTVIPIVNEVRTGTFNDATTGAVVSSAPNPVYVPTDHYYYCSTDYANDYGNWVQLLAHGLGGGGLSIGSGGCPQDSGGSRSYAKWGAKVDDVGVQVNAHLGELHNGVLVAMLAGQNDIMAAYAAVRAGGSSEAAHILMREKGVRLAQIINQVVATGARVVYLTVPDMGKSPEAVLQPALATTLTKAFNEGYKASGEDKDSGGLSFGTIINDGHKIVKVDGYNLIASLGATYGAVSACESDPTKVRMPNGVTIANAAATGSWNTDTINKALLLNCRSNNLKVVTPATSTSVEVLAYYPNYLWADARRLSPMGHANLANLAVARIRDQL